MRAPIGVLKPTAITEAFQALVRKSGLEVPFNGPHCLRHSFAVQLLKSGTPLKTIGDILGHRTAEHPCIYGSPLETCVRSRFQFLENRPRAKE